MAKVIKVGNKCIGKKDTCFIIAEAGVNHNCKLSLAKELVVKAAQAGADAIKFQNYNAEKLVTKTAPRFWDWEGEEKKKGTQFDSYSKLDKLPKEDYKEIVKCCKENGIIFMSTPFDKDNVDFLEDLNIEIYKIASCDITNLLLLKYVAEKMKPMILSTGTANMQEIREAIDVIYATGNRNVVLLHCTLCYPTDFKDVNLRMMQTMMKEFSDIPIGLSDHSLGIIVPLAAVALGATVIEKHYTVNKRLKISADHWLSVDAKELRGLVKNKNYIIKALGKEKKERVNCERPAYKYARRSLVANCFIPKGCEIKEDMIAVKRPGTGVSPKYYDSFIGKIANKDIKEDELLEWTYVKG